MHPQPLPRAHKWLLGTAVAAWLLDGTVARWVARRLFAQMATPTCAHTSKTVSWKFSSPSGVSYGISAGSSQACSDETCEQFEDLRAQPWEFVETTNVKDPPHQPGDVCATCEEGMAGYRVGAWLGQRIPIANQCSRAACGANIDPSHSTVASA